MRNSGPEDDAILSSDAGDNGRHQVMIAFDDNRLASVLFGQYGQNLALIERRLGVDARARGNMVSLAGPPGALMLARRVLESLYERLLEHAIRA